MHFEHMYKRAKKKNTQKRNNTAGRRSDEEKGPSWLSHYICYFIEILSNYPQVMQKKNPFFPHGYAFLVDRVNVSYTYTQRYITDDVHIIIINER